MTNVRHKPLEHHGWCNGEGRTDADEVLLRHVDGRMTLIGLVCPVCGRRCDLPNPLRFDGWGVPVPRHEHACDGCRHYPCRCGPREPNAPGTKDAA